MLPEACRDRVTLVVGQLSVPDDGPPRLLLGQLLGPSSPCGQGVPPTEGGVVSSQLGVDRRTVEESASRQRLDHRPAQVRVDEEAGWHPAPVEHAFESRCLLDAGDLREGTYAGQLQVAPGNHLGDPAGLGEGPPQSIARRGVERRGGGGLGQQCRDDRRVGLAVHAGKHGPDERGYRQLGVAARVPQGRPAQDARERVAHEPEVGQHRLLRALVEADLGEGEVTVVRQHQVGRPGHRREGLAHLELAPLPQDQLAVHPVVHPDADQVGAQSVGGEPALDNPDRAHPGGLQPAPGPFVQVASARALQLHQEILERGVGEGVALEVGAHPGEEGLLTDARHELPQDRSALGVGDPVEVQQGAPGVRNLALDRVRARQLVGAVAPRLAAGAEVDPGALVAGRPIHGQEAQQLGEGLVEPQVVPPAHRHQVAEPHVRHLVGDHHGPLSPLVVGDPGAEDEVLTEGHCPRVLHGTVVELRDEQLVVGVAERVGAAEQVLLEREALLRQLEQLVRVGVEVGGERLPHVKAQPASRDLAIHAVPRTRRHREQVGADPLGRREGPAITGLLPAGVPDDRPPRRCLDGQPDTRFQVRLVEAGEHPLCVVEEAHRPQVDEIVGRVAEPVQPLSRTAVGAARSHRQPVLGGEVGQRQPVPVEGAERCAVELGRHQLAVELDEGARPWLAAGEGDDADAVEPVRTGEDECDVVRGDLQQRRPGAGLVPRQVLHASTLGPSERPSGP